MTNGSLMKVTSIAKGSILQYFWPALSDNWSWKQFLVFLRVAVLHRFYCNTFYLLKFQRLAESEYQAFWQVWD